MLGLLFRSHPTGKSDILYFLKHNLNRFADDYRVWVNLVYGPVTSGKKISHHSQVRAFVQLNDDDTVRN